MDIGAPSQNRWEETSKIVWENVQRCHDTALVFVKGGSKMFIQPRFYS